MTIKLLFIYNTIYIFASKINHFIMNNKTVQLNMSNFEPTVKNLFPNRYILYYIIRTYILLKQSTVCLVIGMHLTIIFIY